MPGMVGAVGTTPDTARRVVDAFRRVWGDVEEAPRTLGALAAHAHEGGALFSTASRCEGAVDGEWSIYQNLRTRGGPGRLFALSHDGLDLSPDCRGNVALLMPDGDTVHLATEWTGTFPLYYATGGGGLLFSSHIRPMTAVLGTEPDRQAVIEFLREGYTTSGRTVVRGIRRLMPGQSLTYAGGNVHIRETSRAWQGNPESTAERRLEERAFDLLVAAIRNGVPMTSHVALMMSAGWDSRTLLGAIQAAGVPATLYSHGDVESRELNIVERLGKSRGMNPRIEPIDDRIYDLGQLRFRFDRVETAVFPHWLRAGGILSAAGAAVAVAGVYGEILGGHYGGVMVRKGAAAKAWEFAMTATRGSRADPAAGATTALEALRPQSIGVDWCLRREFLGDSAVRIAEIGASVKGDLERLVDRGIDDPTRLLEAYIAEHRGSHYINAQLLSCRGDLDVAAPFIDRELLCFASRLPFKQKIHNRINQLMLARCSPGLLEFPTAAILVPPTAPLLLQEGSRAIRKLYEAARWELHFRSERRLPPPRLAWVNFEFLRRSGALNSLMDDLRLDLWDRPALRRRIESSQNLLWKRPMHPLYDMLNKIYSVDLLLREH